MTKGQGLNASRVNISAVAERAGVSNATVSRVVSGSLTVSDQLAEKVRRAVSELNYRPNGSARGLASGLHHSIGLVMPDMSNPHFFEVVQSIASAAAQGGFRVVIADTRGEPHEERKVCEELLTQCDGLILLSPRMSQEDLRFLASLSEPVVAMNRVSSGVGMPMIGVDSFAAMLKICQHLLQLGHRRVVYLSGSPLAWQSQERWRGIQSASLFGIEAVQVFGDSTITSGYTMADEVLSHEPTAVICYNDLLAFGLMASLRDKGLKVPTDISVTGFDDIELARHCYPALTSVRAPDRELGEMAWDLFSRMLEGKPLAEPGLSPAEVIVRESTGPAPTLRAPV